MSFLSLVSLIFVVAKTFGFVNWNWFMVFLPFLIEIAIGLLKAVLELGTRKVDLDD